MTTNQKPSKTEPATAPFRYTAALACEIESRWQKVWDQEQAFRVPNPGQAGFDASKPKFYCLDMFPYPSGAGLHVGHPEGYTATDIISRYKRLTGHNVLHPMGWDAFGLPAEQYAIETGIHPAQTTQSAIGNFRRQLKRFGFSYDWSREISTIDPAYYKWTQWIFLQAYNAWFDPEEKKARPISELVAAFEKGNREPKINPDAAEYAGTGDLPGGTHLGDWAGLEMDLRRMVLDSYRLAYVGRQTVNWCPKLGTALANEEVIDGKSERGSFPVFRKPMQQWMFRITTYADRLLEGLGQVDWPNSTKVQQTEWIGRSRGAEIDFAILGDDEVPIGQSLRVFTTRPDTIFGATYMVVAPEHPIVDAALDEPAACTDENALRVYVEQARNLSDVQRMESKEKTGIFTGYYTLNPATQKPIPIWTADYVLMGYGTGAIMAVPAHDERDFAFAKAFDLPITRVVDAPASTQPKSEEVFSGEGTATNSGFLDGLPTAQAKAHTIEWLEKHQIGMGKVNYRLRDWLFSRQRYWGEPFPIVWDKQGHHHAVSAETLPVLLPDMVDYAPIESDDPKPLLAKATDWLATTAGKAGVAELEPQAPVTRETNTMPGWAGSCWYHLRYCDPNNETAPLGQQAERYWLGQGGVDLYVGGNEHAVLHLLYARFWHKMLYDLGFVSTDEPFKKLFHQGMITSHAYQRANKTLVPVDQVDETSGSRYIERATGSEVVHITAKMSKSLKNVVNPDDVIEAYGADTFRLYEMYMGPLEATKPWNTTDIIGLHRFLQRVWRLTVDVETGGLVLCKESTSKTDAIERQLHRTIAKVGSDIDRLSFNTAIAAMIEFVNIATGTGLTKDQLDRFARILSPFAPHIAEELWHKMGNTGSIAHATWPGFDEAMLHDETVEIVVQILGKTRAKLVVPADADADTLETLALADAKIQALIEGKTIRKVIAVPGRLVNIVAN